MPREKMKVMQSSITAPKVPAYRQWYRDRQFQDDEPFIKAIAARPGRLLVVARTPIIKSVEREGAYDPCRDIARAVTKAKINRLAISAHYDKYQEGGRTIARAAAYTIAQRLRAEDVTVYNYARQKNGVDYPHEHVLGLEGLLDAKIKTDTIATVSSNGGVILPKDVPLLAVVDSRSSEHLFTPVSGDDIMSPGRVYEVIGADRTFWVNQLEL